MNEKIPNTPFSTPLSGSARETERRIQNIMSGPKKRPPLPLMILVFAVCLLCGNLVSCQVAEGGDPVRLNHAGDVSLEEGTPVPVTYEPADGAELALLETLFRTAERENGYKFQVPAARLMNFIQQGDYTLGAVFVEDHLENTLILGVVDKKTGQVCDTVFQCSHHVGVPNTVTFRNRDGDYCLLYTFNGQENGQYTGEAGVVRMDGNALVWEWPVEGDIQTQAQAYQEYWNGRLALMAPGGVDLYTVNPDFAWGQEDPWSMWQLDHGETFYDSPSSAEELPMPVYFQSLSWLIEYTNDPGGWRIVSLTQDGENAEEGLDCFTLRAQSDDGANKITANLFFPYEQEGNRRAYGSLDRTKGHSPAPEQRDKWSDEEKEEKKNNHKAERQEDKDDWDWGDWDVWDDGSLEAWKKEQEEKQIAEYQSVGVTVDGKNYYYQGQLVNVFLDQRPDRSVWTLDKNPAGTVHIKILRSADGAISGVTYMTDTEAAEVWDGMD